MNYDEFSKYVKQEKLDKNVLLLYGEEQYLKNHSKEKLLTRLMPENMPEFNLFKFEGKKYDLNAVDDAIESLPVFSEWKLILFYNSMIFNSSHAESATKEYKEYWEKRLSDIPENVYIVFDEQNVDKRSKLYKLLVNQNAFAEFNYLSEQKMIQWTVNLFKTYGKILSPHDAKYLIENVGEGMMPIKREAEKITSYTQGEINITRAVIDAVIIPVIENRVFEMVDAILTHDINAALLKLKDLFALKEDETKILGAIISNIDRLLSVKLMLDSNMTRTQILAESDLKPFFVSKFIPLCAKYTKEDLENLLTECVNLDSVFKSQQCNKGVLLERLIVGFVAKI